MAKRKRETADEESSTPQQRKNVKKQKTSKIRISQAKDAAPKHIGSKGSAQLPPVRANKNLAGKLTKREKRTLEKLQRGGSERKEEIKTAEDNEDIRLVKIRGTKLLEKGQSAAAPDRHVSRKREKAKREKEGGQTSTGKHKTKQEKRRDKTFRQTRKKSKEKDIETATWKVSDPLGGQMLDVDPIFSPDEK